MTLMIFNYNNTNNNYTALLSYKIYHAKYVRLEKYSISVFF